MSKILINDILNFTPNEIPNIKIKFNIYNGYHDPLDLYKADPDMVNIEWFLWKDKRRYFYVGQTAICFLKLSGDRWLLTTIKKIIKELNVDPNKGGIGYEAEVISKYEKYFGRLVVRYHNTSRAMGRTYDSVMGELEVLEILNDPFTGEGFPGFDNVRLSYQQLKTVIDRQLPGWIDALQNQKAVYLITDNKTGKLYVGSATSESGMLLQRWSEYVRNGHGGNTDLKALIEKEGFDYVKQNFQYSILENYNARKDDDYIRARETWWKVTLRTKEFGYNKN